MQSSFSRVIKHGLASDAPPQEVGVREIVLHLAMSPEGKNECPADVSEVQLAEKAGLLAEVRAEAEREKARALAEAEQIRAEARQDGFRAGYEQGRQALASEEEKLRTSAIQHLAEAQREAEALLARAGEERARLLGGLENEVLELAIAVAEKVLHAHLQVAPQVVLEVVREALREAGTAASYSVRLNPADMEHVRENLPSLAGELPAEAQLELVPDNRMGTGGCLVETPQSQVDATLAGQLERVAEALREGGGA